MSENSKFELGDTVMLKSGGPLMTVAIAKPNNVYHCVWFKPSGEINTQDFYGYVLTMAAPEKKREGFSL
jgi:uncharacterized protein YodC (DUF2158 family)